MGTSGTIKFVSTKKIDFQKQIDSILIDVNMSLSTYIDSSTLTKFNSNKIELKEAMNDSYFKDNFEISKSIYLETNTAFNPAILPLVNYWKVQDRNENSYKLKVDSAKIDSIVKSINAKNNFKKNHTNPLDFSAIAKGYGIDVVANFLEQNAIENYMVEIGGEVRCKGKNLKNTFWKIGIEAPNEKERKLYDIVSIENMAMATSGNYRNFKVLDSGQKIVHIINPKTGYPEMSNLLSASIITKDCAHADAYATACMVMGKDTCFNFILSNTNLECYLIYSDKNGKLQAKYTKGFEKYLAE